jgi:hypothetical protein
MCFSPLFVTEVSQGEFGHWAAEQFPPVHGTARERILRTFCGQALFWQCKNIRKYLKSLAHPTGFEPVTSAFGVGKNEFPHVPLCTDKLPQA